MRARLALLFWWFLLYANGRATVVGPFRDQTQCESIQKEMVSQFFWATACWDDTQQNTLRR